MSILAGVNADTQMLKLPPPTPFFLARAAKSPSPDASSARQRNSWGLLPAVLDAFRLPLALRGHGPLRGVCGGSADLAKGRAHRIRGAVGRVREDSGKCRSFTRRCPRRRSGLSSGKAKAKRGGGG